MLQKKKKNVNPKLEQIRFLQLIEKRKKQKQKKNTFQETIPRNLSWDRYVQYKTKSLERLKFQSGNEVINIEKLANNQLV